MTNQVNCLYRFGALASLALAAACAPSSGESGPADAGSGDDALTAGSADVLRGARLRGDVAAALGGSKAIGRVASLINEAASRYGAGAGDVPAFVAAEASRIYAPDASIFNALIRAGVLPDGRGPGFFAGALDGLNAGGQTLRVLRVCDVVGVTRPDGGASVVFTNVARRGPEGQPELLETERFDLAPPGPGGGAIVLHDIVAPEVVGVSSCDGPEAAAARDAACALAGAASCAGPTDGR